MKTIRNIIIALMIFSCMSLNLQGQESPVTGSDFYDTDLPTSSTELFTEPLLQRGNFMIGTGIGFSTAQSKVDISGPSTNFDGEGGTATQLNLSPSLGYFFARNFVLGIGMNYIFNQTSTPEDFDSPNAGKVESSNTDVLFGPFARIYLPFLDNKALFISTTMGFGKSEDEFISDSGIQSVDNDLFTASIGPGFTIMAADGLALEAIVKYNYTRSESDIILDGEARSTTTKTNAFDFSVGIRYYFRGFQPINE